MLGMQDPSDPQEEFALEVERTANRLRSMSLEKLAQGSKVVDTRTVINRIARCGLELNDISPQDVPELSPAALADQLVVVARALGKYDADSVLQEFSQSLRDLRATL